MPTHDCKTCKASGDCPIESIAPWLNEHEEETTDAVKSCADGLAAACAHLTLACPSVLTAQEDVVLMAQACCLLGYHKGRTYQDVPQVFKEMDK